MRRLLITLLLLLGLSTVASARDSVKGWCEEGNRPVVTSGLSSTTRVQASHPSCIITVYIHGAGLATIYADNNGTPLANPFTAQSGGRWQAYANNGRYDVTMSSAGFSQTITYSDIILCDPFETGSTCNNGGAVTAHNLLSTTHLDTVPESPPVRGDLITAQNQTSPSGVTPAWAALPLGSAGQVLLSNGLDALWGTLTAGTGITITNTGSPPGSTITISTSGGGGGCSLPGNDRGVLSEHPASTCYDSAHWTWNDDTNTTTTNGQIMLAGDGTNTVAAPSGSFSFKNIFLFGNNNSTTLSGGGGSSPFVENFAFGDHNSFQRCQICVAIGDTNSFIGNSAGSDTLAFGSTNNLTGVFLNVLGSFNTVNAADVTIIGESNLFNSAGTGSLTNTGQILIGEYSSTVTLSGNNAAALDVQMIGSFDSITVGQPSGGNLNQVNCLHGVGGNNSFTVTGGIAASHNIQSVSWVGKTNGFTANGFNINTLIVSGNNNTLNATSANLSNSGIFGKSNTLANCSDCYIVGENVSLSTNNTLALGMSASDIGLVITNSGGTHDNVRRTPMVFASLPACAAGTEGSFAAITNSTTATWGATITGGGTNHVLGYCDGTNWTVAGL